MTKSRRGSPPCGGGSRAVTHADILRRFPTIEQLADAISVPRATAYSWKYRDSIPSEYWRDIVRIAREMGIRGVSLPALKRIAEQRGEERRLSRRATRSQEPLPNRISFP